MPTAARMRTRPIGTGPFKFVELKQNESISWRRTPTTGRRAGPYLDAIEFRIIRAGATSILAFVANQYDLTFTADIAAPALQDLKSQAPWAQCELPADQHPGQPAGQSRPAAVRQRAGAQGDGAGDRPARPSPRSSAQGTNRQGGAMLPPPEGLWGMPDDFLATVAGYGADIQKQREEGRKIMAGLGYSADKPLKIKVSTRNIPSYRDQAVILIDHLKQVWIQAELEPVETAVWYNRPAQEGLQRRHEHPGRRHRRSGRGVLRDLFLRLGAQLHELLQSRDREAVRPAVAHGRHCGTPEAGLGDRQEAAGRRRPPRHPARPGRHLLAPGVKGIKRSVNSIYNHWRFEDVWLDR
jgi:peptide/nickel transport system substrate-binding protein